MPALQQLFALRHVSIWLRTADLGCSTFCPIHCNNVIISGLLSVGYCQWVIVSGLLSVGYYQWVIVRDQRADHCRHKLPHAHICMCGVTDPYLCRVAYPLAGDWLNKVDAERTKQTMTSSIHNGMPDSVNYFNAFEQFEITQLKTVYTLKGNSNSFRKWD